MLSILQGKKFQFCTLAAFAFPEEKKEDMIKSLKENFDERCKEIKTFNSKINEIRYYIGLCETLPKSMYF